MNSTKSISQYNCQQNGEIYAFFDQILMAQKCQSITEKYSAFCIQKVQSTSGKHLHIVFGISFDHFQLR